MIEQQEQKKYSEHKVVLSEYVEATLKIPKVMTPLELETIIGVFKDVLKSANMSIEQVSQQTITSPVSKSVKKEKKISRKKVKKEKKISRKKVKRPNIWTEETSIILATLYDSGITRKVIADRLKAITGTDIYDKNRIKYKITNMRVAGKFNSYIRPERLNEFLGVTLPGEKVAPSQKPEAVSAEGFKKKLASRILELEGTMPPSTIKNKINEEFGLSLSTKKLRNKLTYLKRQQNE